MNNIEDTFDEKKIKNAVRRAKLKLILKIIVISMLVFIVGSYINFKIFLKYSEKSYEANEAYVKASVPNGYISESNDICGFLGGSGTYKVSKDIGRKPVILEDNISLFGILPPINFFRGLGGGGGYHISGNWPVSFWENGYKKMRFFHPELKYKEYQNDLDNIDKIPDGKIIEMGLSFDRPYKINQMDLVLYDLQSAEVTWAWLDEFEQKKIEKFKKEIEEYDPKACGIYENELVGIGVGNKFILDYNNQYEELLNNLKESKFIDHKNLYNEIMKRGKTSKEDAKVLGVVVQGTKEELKKLKGNPMIKAASIGIVTDELY